MLKRRYGLFFCAALLLCAGSGVQAKNYVTLLLDVEEKEMDVTGLPGIRETINVRLTNTLTYAAADLRFALIGISNGTNALMATCTNFSDMTGYFEGELDLNTVALTNFFVNMSHQATRDLTAVLVDSVNNDTLVNDAIEVQNNPYTEGMGAPETVDPLLAVTYAPLANGVSNGDSHDHSGGDGAQIDHTTLDNIGTHTHAQIDTELDAVAGVVSTAVGALSNAMDEIAFDASTVSSNAVLGAAAYAWGDHSAGGYLTVSDGEFWNITAANTSATYLATTIVSNGTFTGSASGWVVAGGLYTANTILCPLGSTTTLTQSNRMAVLTDRVYRVTMDLDTDSSGEGVLISIGGKTNTWGNVPTGRSRRHTRLSPTWG